MDKNVREIDVWMNEISHALSETRDPALIYDFLSSILTPNEFEEVATRWALVKLMDSGMSQRRIASELGLSLCKITRGSKELKKENSPFEKMIRTHEQASESITIS